MSRDNPFDLAFAPLRDRFERIRESQGGADPGDRDRFLLNRDVAALLLELRPEEGYGDATEAMAALVHHAYRFWDAGETIRSVTAEQLSRIVEPDGIRSTLPSDRPAVVPSYVQLPPLTIWGVLEAGSPEPLDGWFSFGTGAALNVLAVLGIRSGRAGFTTLEVRGRRPGIAPVFAPLQSGVEARAALATVRSEAELLELAWRVETLG